MTTLLERVGTGAGLPARRMTSSIVGHRAFAPAVVAILGFTISIIGSTVPSVWYDEVATITGATRSWPQFWAMIGNVDAVHALYYVGMHLVFDIFGYSPFTLRLPSALAVAAGAALVVVLGRQLGRARLGLIAGLIFCMLPRITWAGTEGRSYAITAALAVLMTVILVKASGSIAKRWWFVYAAVAVFSITVFLYLGLIVVAHGVTVVWALARRERTSWFVAKRWMLAAVAVSLASLPFARVVVAQSGQVSWIDPIGALTLLQLIRAQWFYSSWWFAAVAWALIAIGIIAAQRRSDRMLLTRVLPALLVPSIALVAISVVVGPVYQPRYLTMCAPFVAIAIAAGLDVLAARWRLLAVLAIAALAVLAVPQIISQRVPEAKENSAWSQVAELISNERALDGEDVTSAIIYGNVQRHPSATARVMAYSYPDAFAGTVDVTLGTPAVDTAHLWESRIPLIDSLERLDGADVTYLITSNARDLRAVTIGILAGQGWRVTQTWDFTYTHVLRFERD